MGGMRQVEVKFDNFNKGIMSDGNHHELPPGYVRDAVNARIVGKSLHKRLGYGQIGTLLSGETVPKSGTLYAKVDGTEITLVHHGDNIFEFDEVGGFSLITDPISTDDLQVKGNRAEFDTFIVGEKDWCIISNNDTPSIKWYDGTNWSHLGVEAPTGTLVVSNGGAGAIPAAVYKYLYTFVKTGGEEGNPSPIVEVDSTSFGAGPFRHSLTNLIGGDSDIVSKKIYRTTAGGSIFYYLDTIAAAATIYSDNKLDSDLGTSVYWNHDMPQDRHEFVTVHKGRIFTAHPDKDVVYFSLPYQKDYFPYNYFRRCNLDEGDRINGLISVGDALLVMCQKSIHVLYGDSEPDFFIEKAKWFNSGCASRYSIVRHEGYVFFMTYDGVVITDGKTFRDIATNTISYTIEDIDGKGVCHADMYDGRYHLFYATDGVTIDRSLVYDTEYAAWTRDTGMYVNDLIVNRRNGVAYGVPSSIRSHVSSPMWLMWEALFDDGDAIQFSMITGKKFYPYDVSRKEYDKIHMFVGLSNNIGVYTVVTEEGTASGSISPDSSVTTGSKYGIATYGTVYPYGAGGSGGVEDILDLSLTQYTKGRWAYVTIDEVGDSSGFKIHFITLNANVYNIP